MMGVSVSNPIYVDALVEFLLEELDKRKKALDEARETARHVEDITRTGYSMAVAHRKALVTEAQAWIQMLQEKQG